MRIGDNTQLDELLAYLDGMHDALSLVIEPDANPHELLHEVSLKKLEYEMFNAYENAEYLGIKIKK